MAQTDTTKVFAARLEELTEAMRDTDPKMSNAKQAKEMGIPYSTFNKYLYNTAECSISTITTIANYYGVSVDYLLGRTDVKTADTDLKAICEYTGLSEKSVECLNILKDTIYLPNSRGVIIGDIITKEERDEVLSKIISFDFLFPMVGSMFVISKNSKLSNKKITNEKLIHIDSILHFDEKTQNKIKDYQKKYWLELDKLKPFEQRSVSRINLEIEILRYNNTKLIEKLNDIFDHSKDYLSYSKKELIEYLKKNIDENLFD